MEYSGGRSYAVTKGGTSYFVYLRHDSDPKTDPDGNNTVYIRTLNRRTGALSPRKFLFESSPDFADSHSAPVMAIDTLGYIHVQGGAHAGTGFKYRKSTVALNIDSWTNTETIGSARTYSELLIDDLNRMYSLFRASSPYKLHFQSGTSSDGFTNDEGTLFADQRCSSNYRIFYHRLHKDRNNNRIFSNWTAYCGKGATSDYYRVLAFTDDGGTNWKIPTLNDFLENITNGKEEIYNFKYGGYDFQGVTAGDYDGDGIDEVAIYRDNTSGVKNRIIIFEADGTYIRDWELIAGGSSDIKGITSGDFNNDGTDEIVVYRLTSNGDSQVVIFNATNGAVYRDWNSRDIFYGITAGDYDGDGIDELAFYKYNTYGTTKNRIVIYEADGTYIRYWDFGGYDYKGITSGNFNNDGTDEIAVYRFGFNGRIGFNGNNRVIIFNATNGTYIREWISYGNDFHGIAAGDYDGDGIDELAFYKYSAPYYVAKNRVIIYETDGEYIGNFLDRNGFDIKGIASGNFNDDAGYEIVTIARNRIKVHEYIPPSTPIDHFILKVRTTTAGENFIFYTQDTNYDIDWNNDRDFTDTKDKTEVSGNQVINFADAGDHIIRFRNLTDIFIHHLSDESKYISVEQWGNAVWNANMYDAFSGANNLTIAPDAGKPNMSQVTNMGTMFWYATSFNQDMGNWNVSNVTNMHKMFHYATSFDQNLGNWDVSNVTNFSEMFTGVTLSSENYDALLIGWSERALQQNMTFDAGDSKFCSQAAKDAKTHIENTYNWTINDAGQCTIPEIIITQVLSLDTGWNLVGFNVEPINNYLSDIFKSVSFLVQINSQTQSYNPSLSNVFNLLTSLENGRGYYIHLNRAEQITLTGANINLSETSIPLSSGWNLISYPSQNVIDIQTGLSNISQYIVKVSSQNKSYNPVLSDVFNTLHQLKPGKGYWIKVSQNCNLNF